MFTGIIEATAAVRRVQDGSLTLERPAAFTGLAAGASVAVSGVCLSVTEYTEDTMTFAVVEETSACSTLGSLREGDAVNLERAMRADARFEGHIVQGHVECTAEVVCTEPQGQQVLLTVRLPEAVRADVVPKGSVAIDGVSLTVAKLEDGCCSVALIPHTCAGTTLGALRPGDTVNIETDVLSRYVRSALSRQAVPS